MHGFKTPCGVTLLVTPGERIVTATDIMFQDALRRDVVGDHGRQCVTNS